MKIKTSLFKVIFGFSSIVSPSILTSCAGYTQIDFIDILNYKMYYDFGYYSFGSRKPNELFTGKDLEQTKQLLGLQDGSGPITKEAFISIASSLSFINHSNIPLKYLDYTQINYNVFDNSDFKNFTQVFYYTHPFTDTKTLLVTIDFYLINKAYWADGTQRRIYFEFVIGSV